jgi:hypothetical protein
MDGRVVFGAQDYGNLSPSLPDILPVWSPFNITGATTGLPELSLRWRPIVPRAQIAAAIAIA